MIDFEKINIKPLQSLGLSEKQARELILVMVPVVNLKLQIEMDRVLGDEDFEGLAERGMEERVLLLDERYRIRTGKYLLEEAKRLMDEAVVGLAELFKGVKKDIGLFKGLEKSRREEIERLFKEKDYQRAVRLLEKSLKEADNG